MAIYWMSGLNWQPKIHASGPNMLLLWDGGAAPTGWTDRSADYAGRFIRGEAAANAISLGTPATGVGGSATHTPAVSSTVVNTGVGQAATGCVIGCNARSTAAHTHTTTAPTIGAANNLPVYRSLKLISYNSGIPNVIPAGAIAFFDSTTGVPTGWTRQSAQDGNMIRIDTTVSTGGSDTHTHTVTWNSLAAAAGTANAANTSAVGAAASHTHTAPAASTTDSQSSVPPYVQTLMAKADADTAAIPSGLISMFDNDPGAGWVVRSNSGGTFYQKFNRPNSTYNASPGGSTTHTHNGGAAGAGLTSGVSGGPSATGTVQGAGTGLAGSTHTHTITTKFVDNTDNTPQYLNVVYAQKVGFTVNSYRWYVDSDAQDVTDPWGNPDIAQATPITIYPLTNKAPIQTNELRLRINMIVGGVDLPASNSQFKLQYKQGTDGSCTAGSWTDVGAGGGAVAWRYASSSVTDGTALTVSRLSPASDVLQKYVKVSPSATNTAATVGQTIEYDFHIEHNGAVGAAQYSFRIIESTGALLADHTVCPTLTTNPDSGNLMRHGNYFSNETEGGFLWAD